MLGDNIRKIREAKQMGLNELAKKADVSSSYLSSLERGVKNNPSIDMLEKIAKPLEISVNQLFDNECSISLISKEISIDEGIVCYESLLSTDSENINLYSKTLSWLKELKELREFKNIITDMVKK